MTTWATRAVRMQRDVSCSPCSRVFKVACHKFCLGHWAPPSSMFRFELFAKRWRLLLPRSEFSSADPLSSHPTLQWRAWQACRTKSHPRFFDILAGVAAAWGRSQGSLVTSWPGSMFILEWIMRSTVGSSGPTLKYPRSGRVRSRRGTRQGKLCRGGRSCPRARNCGGHGWDSGSFDSAARR